MKQIAFIRTLNTRSLEGYTNQRGQVIKPWRLLRSDALTHLTSQEIDLLTTQGVTTQVDLRTPYVANKYASPLRVDHRFNYHLFPIVEGTKVPLVEEEVPHLYMAMLSHYETFKDILEAIAKAPHGVIYNCSAGKDRTGMVTFLLLELAGVARDVIATDYEISSKLIEAKLPAIRQIDPSFPAFLGYSKREYIEKFFILFDEKFSNIDTYLNTIGLAPQYRQALLDKMFS